jgi:hypothetical protein
MIDAGKFGDNKSHNRVVFSSRTQFTPGQVSDDEYLICETVVPGFALTEKKWCWFFVDVVQDVDFNDEAFNKLFLPPTQKRLLQALVENHISTADKFDDIIEGKGKGLVFALHGEPGIGKTFTVESLADRVKRPLYVLMTGELGLTSDSVEKNLHKALSLAVSWNAIVLVDEADVFMEQRSAHDITRNGLVSSQSANDTMGWGYADSSSLSSSTRVLPRSHISDDQPADHNRCGVQLANTLGPEVLGFGIASQGRVVDNVSATDAKPRRCLFQSDHEQMVGAEVERTTNQEHGQNC